MRLLLDTHTIIWYIRDDPRLPDSIRKMIKDNANDVYVSAISLWEISIKSRKGTLNLNRTLHDLARLLRRQGFRFLAVRMKHVFRLDTLDLHHKDPFDRMLIAQSLAGGFALVGCDEVFDQYGIRRLW
jgi:PIN domain nuclease of toxin-antitoxin system